MPQVILLGTGAAISAPDRENTFLLIRGAQDKILIDCAGSPSQRLARIGLSPAEIDHVILTHHHPDHIYGWTIFALNAWMAHRQAPLQVYGLAETIRAARGMLRSVGYKDWPGFYRIHYHVILPQSIGLVLTTSEFTISATRTDHFVPTLALRVTNRQTGASIAYSADTTPQDNVIELARDSKYLFHEATTLLESSTGHTSALEAGQQAQRAQAQNLVLVHLPPDVQPAEWEQAARRHYKGPICVGSDFDTFEF